METVLLYFFCTALIGIISGFFCGIVLAPRTPRIGCWFPTILATIMLTPTAIVRSLSTNDYLHFMSLILQIIILFIICCIYSSDSLWRKIFAVLNFLIAVFISEMSAMTVMHNLGIGVPSTNIDYLIFHIFNDMFLLIFSSFFIILWHALLKKSLATVRHIWLFPLFPISQLISYFSNWYHARKVIGIYFGNPLSWFGTFLGFIADILLLYILVKQSEKEMLEKKLYQLQTLQAAEEAHYHNLMERQHEISKLQHDYKNQLSAALRLLAAQKTEQSKELLLQITKALSSSGNPFCPNLVINAVLEEKSALASRADILFNVECQLPEQIHIPPYHLCSAFSNLLDNAINAASSCLDATKFITVKAVLQNSCLIIKVENSAITAKSPSLSGHGYGQLILEDLAKQYSGDFYTNFENGIYSAILTLNVLANF